MTRESTWAYTFDIALPSAWLGAALTVAAVVAPAAFAVLPTRALAGALVGRILPPLFFSGMFAGAIGAAFAGRMPSRVARATRRVASGIMFLSCAVAQLAIAPRIDAVRSSIPGAVESLAADDPQRVLFGRLHAMSVGCLGLAMLAALLIAVLATRAQRLAQRVDRLSPS